MRKKRRVAARIALLLLAGAVAACRPNQSVEGQTRDAKTKTTIKSRLASEVNASTLLSVEVNVTNGVVTLAGPVHSQDESRKIESVARGVAGVTDVRNDLQVLATETVPTSPAATPPAATPAAGRVG